MTSRSKPTCQEQVHSGQYSLDTHPCGDPASFLAKYPGSKAPRYVCRRHAADANRNGEITVPLRGGE